MKKATAKPKRPHLEKLKIFQKKKKICTTPIDDSLLSIREMKSSDRFNVLSMINESKRDYYINVYNCVFRSWFTYGIIACLLALSLSLIQSSLPSVCLPPFVITLILIWKVNRYKRVNRTYSIIDLESMNLNETQTFKYKSAEQRRANQGVYLVFYKKEHSFEDYDLLDSDFDLSSSDSENENDKKSKDNDSEKILVGYMAYAKQRDELETVSIKEICIHKDYRQRKICSNFIRRMYNNVFRTYGYRRVTFIASNFHQELVKAINKKGSLIRNIQSWTAWTLVPGVIDERTVFAFNMFKLNKET